MPYYPTLAEDVARAKEILAKGKADALPPNVKRCRHCKQLTTGTIGKPPCDHDIYPEVSGTIYGADIYAAYRLLQSFVEAIEAVDPKVCEVALRCERLAARQVGPDVDGFGGVVVRQATDAEQRAAIVAAARQRVAQGAGHDCGEWRTAAGTCELCDRVLLTDADVDRFLAETAHSVDDPARVERVRRLYELKRAAADCVCRSPNCGHTAAQHVGQGGACIVPGCTCGPGGWS